MASNATEADRAVRIALRREQARGVGLAAVGVSGGPDSVFLLDRLVAVREPDSPRLLVLHIDHRARPGSADDAAFCARLAARLSLPFRCLRADPEVILRAGRASEGRLRAERYRLFEQAMTELGATALFLAHHRDDQIEGIVLAALRGAGLTGLGGVPRRRALDGGRVIRPLLGVSRSTILQVLDSRGLPFLQDPTNRDRSYLRNRVRLEFLPALRRDLGADLDRRLLRLARIARVAARRARDRARRGTLADSDSRHAALVAMAGRPLSRRISRLAQDLMERRGSGVIQVDARTRLVIDAGEARRAAAATADVAPGRVTVSQHAHAARLLRAIESLPPAERRRRLTGRGRYYLDLDRLGGPLCLRHRMPGDRLTPLGREVPSKLKELLIAAKIPRSARDQLAVLADRDRVIVCEGLPPAADVVLRGETSRVLRIVIRRGIR